MQISINTELTEILNNRIRTNALKRLGISTVLELLQYYPRKFESGAKHYKSLKQLRYLFNKNGETEKVLIQLSIKAINIIPMKYSGSKLELIMNDKSGDIISCVFFAKNYRYLSWLKSSYKVGENVIVIGELKLRDSLQFVHPEIIKYTDDFDGNQKILRKISPTTIYPATAKLSSQKIHDTIEQVIELIESNSLTDGSQNFDDNNNKDIRNFVFPNILPPDNLVYGFKNRWECIKALHLPKNYQEYQKALEQLKFEEAFILQTALGMKRTVLSNQKAIPRITDSRLSQYLSSFIERLPFKLTDAQVKVSKEISDDLSKNIGMRRLLQGDVGSGKTLVAILAMLQVIDGGGQCVLIAPTEVLANQHYQNICKMMKDIFQETSQEIILVTGSLKEKEKKLARARIRSESAKIIVGTHAVFFDVDFTDLGLIVVDEQHKFGVEQRNSLLEANKDSHGYIPHMLVMSATPIPRTMAMTVFSDLNISVLDELPSNRQKVDTYMIEQNNLKWQNRMWEKTREEIDQGRNVFIVVPHIDGGVSSKNTDDRNDDDNADIPKTKSSLANVQSIFEKLSSSQIDIEADQKPREITTITKIEKVLLKNDQLKNVKFGVIHGKIKPAQKEEEMRSFINLEKPVLLATQVIEVGIDVPNASVMMIFDADLFSLSTLHQLRGRVGRGKYKSICFLIESKNCTEIGRERLLTMEKTNSGFAISTADLKLRREGDIIGANQAGTKSSLKLLRVVDDQELIYQAHLVASSVLKSDPFLKKHQSLKFAVDEELANEQRDFLVKT